MSDPIDVYPRKLSEEQAEKVRSIQANLQFAIELVNTICPVGRERSLAITKLEEASMWATKAISRGES